MIGAYASSTALGEEKKNGHATYMQFYKAIMNILISFMFSCF